MKINTVVICIWLALMLPGCSGSQKPSNQTITNTGSISATKPMNNSVLTNKLVIQSNVLFVKNLQAMKDFYVNSLWFEFIYETPDNLILGNNGKSLLTLSERPNYASRMVNDAWLYHIAYVHDTRTALANRIAKIASNAPQSFQWSSDHSVSEAFYFTDPEWNGVELYFDRDPSTWVWSSWQIVMWSKFLDPNNYIQSNQWTWDDKFHVWHNHLQVWNLNDARKFYHDILWFDITQDMSKQWALFVSAWWYHHHFWLNTRNSFWAKPRPNQQLWLWTMSLLLEKLDDLQRLEKRLEQNNITYTKKDQTIAVSDPWNNVLEFGIIN